MNNVMEVRAQKLQVSVFYGVRNFCTAISQLEGSNFFARPGSESNGVQEGG